MKKNNAPQAGQHFNLPNHNFNQHAGFRNSLVKETCIIVDRTTLHPYVLHTELSFHYQ